TQGELPYERSFKEIGLIIGKQRLHPNPEVAKLAKEIVKKWKDAVSPSKVNDTSNGSTKSAVPESTPGQNSSSSSPPNTPSSIDSEKRERSFDRDRPPYKNTNNSARDKCVKMLYDSMVFDSCADSDIILLRAITIEKTVFDQFGRQVIDKYRDKLRGLISNLRDKKNPGLRKRIVDGELQAEAFCTMSKEDMASEEKKARDNEIRQENLFKALGAGPTQAETDMFLCGKCRNRKCTYYQMQVNVVK
ncbi:9738_t:CDS:2, partial [Racocetra fulgida]